MAEQQPSTEWSGTPAQSAAQAESAIERVLSDADLLYPGWQKKSGKCERRLAELTYKYSFRCVYEMKV